MVEINVIGGTFEEDDMIREIIFQGEKIVWDLNKENIKKKIKEGKINPKFTFTFCECKEDTGRNLEEYHVVSHCIVPINERRGDYKE